MFRNAAGLLGLGADRPNASGALRRVSVLGVVLAVVFLSGASAALAAPAFTQVGTGTATGSHPYSVAFSPSGGLLATANMSANTVSVFSVSAGGVLTAVGSPTATGASPYSVAFRPSGGLLATANYNANTVSVFAGGDPIAHITSPADQQAYAQNQTVTTSFACTDPTGAPGITSCTDSDNASSPSGTLDTSTLGTYAYTIAATSSDGLASSTTIHYTVVVPPPIPPPTTTPPAPTPAGPHPAGTRRAPRAGHAMRTSSASHRMVCASPTPQSGCSRR